MEVCDAANLVDRIERDLESRNGRRHTSHGGEYLGGVSTSGTGKHESKGLALDQISHRERGTGRIGNGERGTKTGVQVRCVSRYCRTDAIAARSEILGRGCTVRIKSERVLAK